jgi:hypothetical protein
MSTDTGKYSSYFSLTLKLPAQDDGRVWEQVEQLQHHGIQSLLGGEQELLQSPNFRELLTFLRSALLEIFLTPWDPEPAGWGVGAPLESQLQGAPHLPQVSSVRDLSLQHHGIQSLLGGEQELLQEPAFRELLTFLRSAQLEIFCSLHSKKRKENLEWIGYKVSYYLQHRISMELDLRSLFWLHVHSCTLWLRPRNPPPPAIGLYTRTLLVSQLKLSNA